MFLLDTNVVSEMRKIASGKANPKLMAWMAQRSLADLFISSIVLLELR